MERKVDITDVTVAKSVQFSYSVEWYDEPDLLWKNRMSRYADSRFLPSSFEIHWLSIINSFVLVLLLTAFLTIILLRVLKNDFSRYMELDDEAIEEEEVSLSKQASDILVFANLILTFKISLGGSLFMEMSSAFPTTLGSSALQLALAISSWSPLSSIFASH